MHPPRQGTLWALAWPMMLSNLSLPALTLVDAAVLGHLPEPQHLAAVVLGSTLFSFFYWGFIKWSFLYRNFLNNFLLSRRLFYNRFILTFYTVKLRNLVILRWC